MMMRNTGARVYWHRMRCDKHMGQRERLHEAKCNSTVHVLPQVSTYGSSIYKEGGSRLIQPVLFSHLYHEQYNKVTIIRTTIVSALLLTNTLDTIVSLH